MGLESWPDSVSLGVSGLRPVHGGRAYWGASLQGCSYGGTNAGFDNPPWNLAASDATWNLFESHSVKKLSAIAVHQNFTAWDSNPFLHARSRGAFCVLSTGLEGGATIAAINAGTWDAAIDTWAAAAASFGQPLMHRPWWEMNGNWYTWGSTVPAADYVSAWQRFKSRSDAQGAKNISWLWCPNVWGGTAGATGSGLPSAAAWYPGDAYVDWIGLDVYNKATSSFTLDQIFATAYARMLAIANKPMFLAEIGCEEYAAGTSLKAGWITDAIGKLQSSYPKIKGFMFYNSSNGAATDGSAATDTLPIECTTTTPGVYTGTSASTTAFAQAVGSSYWIENVVSASSFPSGQKVPIP